VKYLGVDGNQGTLNWDNQKGFMRGEPSQPLLRIRPPGRRMFAIKKFIVNVLNDRLMQKWHAKILIIAFAQTAITFLRFELFLDGAGF